MGVVIGGTTQKLRHLRRTRHATATFTQGFQWVSADGPIRIIGPDDTDPSFSGDVQTLLREVFVAAGGSHDDWQEYDRVMVADRRAAVFIEPARIIANG